MKEITNKYLLWMTLAVCTLGLHSSAIAQDDLYYDPKTDAKAPVTTRYEDQPEAGNVTRRYDDSNDDYYDENDYAYEYSSRIRRFHRPVNDVDYYDPTYVDLYNYDPFFLPGNTIYTYGYNDYWTWRRWNRFNRWNRWSSWDSWGNNNGWNSWGWNNGFNNGWNNGWNNGFNNGWNNGFNAWSSPWVVNNYYYDPYWTWNGCNPYYSNYYGGNGWNNHYNDNNNGNNGNNGGYQPKTYTGVRRHGTAVNPGYTRFTSTNSGRLTTSTTSAPTIDIKQPRQGQQGKGRIDATTAPATNPTERSNTRTPRPTEGTSGGRVPATTEPGRTTTPETQSQRRSTTPAETRPSRTTPTERPASTREESRPQRRETAPKQEESRPQRRESPAPRQERSEPQRRESAPRQERSEPRQEVRSGSDNSSSRSSGSSSGSSSGRSSSGSSSSGGGKRGRD